MHSLRGFSMINLRIEANVQEKRMNTYSKSKEGRKCQEKFAMVHPVSHPCNLFGRKGIVPDALARAKGFPAGTVAGGATCEFSGLAEPLQAQVDARYS